MRRLRLVVVAAVAALSVVALVAGPASGQQREQDLDEVPVAVSTFTAATLREAVVPTDVAFRAIASDGDATTSPVRIVGAASYAYVFGYPLPAWVEAWELEDSPPLRGPQGELYGRPAVNIRRVGEPGFYSTQSVATGYLVEVEPLPEFSSDEIFEVSLAFSWFGEQGFASSAFAFDPLEGFANFVSTAIIGGEPVDSYGKLVDGVWTQFGDPLTSFDFTEESGAYYLGFVLPGIPENAAFTLSYSPALSLDPMIAQQVAFGQPEMIDAPSLEAMVGDLSVDLQLAYTGLEDSLAPGGVAGDEPTTTTTQVAQPAPAEDPPTANDPTTDEPVAETTAPSTVAPTPIDNLVAIEERGPEGLSPMHFAAVAGLLILLVFVLYISRGLWWGVVGGTLFGRFRPPAEGATSPEVAVESSPAVTGPVVDTAAAAASTSSRVRSLPGSPFPEWGKVWWQTDRGMTQIDRDDVAEAWVRSRLVLTMAVKADEDRGREGTYVAAAYTKGGVLQSVNQYANAEVSVFRIDRSGRPTESRSRKSSNPFLENMDLENRYRYPVVSAPDSPFLEGIGRDTSNRYMGPPSGDHYADQKLREFRLNRTMVEITSEDGAVHLVEDLDPDAPAMAEKVPIWISDDEQVLILADDPDSFFDKLFDEPVVIEDFPDAIPTGDEVAPS